MRQRYRGFISIYSSVGDKPPASPSLAHKRACHTQRSDDHQRGRHCFSASRRAVEHRLCNVDTRTPGKACVEGATAPPPPLPPASHTDSLYFWFTSYTTHRKDGRSSASAHRSCSKRSCLAFSWGLRRNVDTRICPPPCNTVAEEGRHRGTTRQSPLTQRRPKKAEHQNHFRKSALSRYANPSQKHRTRRPTAIPCSV